MSLLVAKASQEPLGALYRLMHVGFDRFAQGANHPPPRRIPFGRSDKNSAVAFLWVAESSPRRDNQGRSTRLARSFDHVIEEAR